MNLEKLLEAKAILDELDAKALDRELREHGDVEIIGAVPADIVVSFLKRGARVSVRPNG